MRHIIICEDDIMEDDEYWEILGSTVSSGMGENEMAEQVTEPQSNLNLSPLLEILLPSILRRE